MSKKILGVGVALALVVTVLVGVGATTASAQTSSMCSVVDALVLAGVITPANEAAARTAAGCGATAPAAGGYTFTRDLTVGSTGADVTALQNAVGVSPATGYFGPITKAAVIAYQTSKGIAPAAGYVGPLTRAALNASVVAPPAVTGCEGGAAFNSLTGASCGVSTVPGCAVGALFSSTTGASCTGGAAPAAGLEGGAGSATYSLLSSLSAEQVGEGESDVKILGFEVEADDGSDLNVTSMKVWFENSDGSTSSSEDLDDYASDVSIMMGSEVVGSASVDDFSASDIDGDGEDEWTKSINLNNAVVRAGDKEKFYVTISANNTIDSADHDSDSWAVDVTNVRFTDASGAVISEDPAITTGVEFDFGTLASTQNVEMKVALSSATPDTGVVEVDATNDTDGVELLRFTIKAVGSDIEVSDIPVLLTVTGATDVDVVANNLVLTVDGDDFQETVSSSAVTTLVVTFDNLGLTIDKGQTKTFVVTADINDIEAGTFDEGDTIKAELSANEVNDIDAQDEGGDSISDTDATGTATGYVQALYSVGIRVELDTPNPSAVSVTGSSATDDIGTFTINYTVTAFGGDVYVSDTDTATTATSFSTVPSNQVLYTASVGGTATVSGLTGEVRFVEADGVTDDGVTNGVLIPEGATGEFTLEATRINTSTLLGSGSWRMVLNGVSWATTDTATQNVFYFNLDDFETPSLPLN